MPTIDREFTIATAKYLLRIPRESDIPFVFSASRATGFNDGMQWDPPADMADLIEPFKRALLAWDAGSSYTFFITNLLDGDFLARIAVRQT